MMGHERVNLLPRSKRWRTIVEQIAHFNYDTGNVPEILNQTLQNVRSRYKNIYNDKGVISAFEFLTIFAVLSRTKNPSKELSSLGIKISENPTPLDISKEIKKWVLKNIQSYEYGQIAQSSVINAIVEWYDLNRTEQVELFKLTDNSFRIWRGTGTGAGFCELARLFFSNFTKQYMSYFLEREASAVIKDIYQRDQFNFEIEMHIDDISKHAFETAKIAQSFAAGWFNKYTKTGIPNKKVIKGFLRLAFEKIREELLRETIN